jgi:hypothetical protein
VYIHEPGRRQVVVSEDSADAVHGVGRNLSELEEVVGRDIELLAAEHYVGQSQVLELCSNDVWILAAYQGKSFP